MDINNQKICLVAVKKIINPYANIKISIDNQNHINNTHISSNVDINKNINNSNNNNNIIDLKNVSYIMNPLDEIALEAAVQLKAQQQLDHIIAVSIGADCKDILTQALARGADEAIFIRTLDFISPLNVAKILKYLIIKNKVNLALLGKQAVDYDFNQTGQMLAGILNWPQACYASKITCHTNELNHPDLSEFHLTINREIDAGTETLVVKLPLVITVDLWLNEPKYLSLNKLLQAKKKSIEIIELPTLIDNQLISLDFNQIQLINHHYPNIPATQSIKINNMQELLQKLIIEDKVLEI